jgi:AsmA protein
MTLRRRNSGHAAMAVAVLGFMAIGIGLPIVVSGTDRFELHSAGLIAATRDRYAISSPLMLQGVPGVVVERGMLALSDKHYNRPLTGEDEAALLASGNARLVLEGATIAVDVNAMPSTGEAVVAPLAKTLAELGFETLAIRRSTIVFRADGVRPTTIGDIAAEITARRKQSIAAKGSVTVRGHKLSLDAALALVAERRPAGASRQQALRFSLKSPLVDVSFDGAVDFADQGALRGQGEIGMKSVREVARAAGLGWPVGPGLSGLKVRGPVTWAQHELSFDKALMQMDGNEASGTLSLTANGGRPFVGGTFALQTLDLSSYAAGWKGEAARSLIDDMMAPGPFALPLVRVIDADVRISANRVRTGGPEFGQSAVTLSLRNGKLLADVAEVAIGDARGTGQVTVDVNGPGPRYSVRGKLTSLDLGRIAPDAQGGAALRGKGDVMADITATGETTYDLLRTVTGKVALAMPSGGRIGIDLRSLLAAAQKQPVSGWAAARGVTNVDSLQGRLVLSEGVVYTETFSAGLGDSLLTASGGGNLYSGQVDLKLSMAARTAAASAPAAHAVDSLMLRGPWHEPLVRAERAPAVAGK